MGYPQIIHFSGNVHYKSSILGTPISGHLHIYNYIYEHIWKHDGLGCLYSKQVTYLKTASCSNHIPIIPYSRSPRNTKLCRNILKTSTSGRPKKNLSWFFRITHFHCDSSWFIPKILGKYGSFLSHGGTPKSSSISMGEFPWNLTLQLWGYHHDYGNPYHQPMVSNTALVCRDKVRFTFHPRLVVNNNSFQNGKLLVIPEFLCSWKPGCGSLNTINTGNQVCKGNEFDVDWVDRQDFAFKSMLRIHHNETIQEIRDVPTSIISHNRTQWKAWLSVSQSTTAKSNFIAILTLTQWLTYSLICLDWISATDLHCVLVPYLCPLKATKKKKEATT